MATNKNERRQISQEKSLSKAIEDEIKKNSLDLSIPYGEILLDSFIDGQAFNEIPVLQTIKGLYKLGVSIRDAHFFKKLLVFLEKYHSNQISNDKVQEFNNKFSKDDEYKHEVVEHIIIYTERLESTLKSQILAYLFLAHTQGFYDWSYYLDLSYCLDHMHRRCIQILKNQNLTSFRQRQTSKATQLNVDGFLERDIIFSELDYGSQFQKQADMLFISSSGIASGLGNYTEVMRMTDLGWDMFIHGIIRI